MDSFVKRLCQYYDLSEGDYEQLTLAPSLSSIPWIDDKEDTKKAIALIQELRDKKQRILVYGDYDTDGVMSCSILVAALRHFGLSVAGYLPSRYLDGYGLNAKNVEKIHEKGFSAIMTCDNGVTAHEALQKAKALGMKVIVLDHHEMDETAPEADVLIHPTALAYGDVPISAGYLSFVFSKALLQTVDPYLMCLGAISTLSDLMPLRDYNRVIVRLMLEEVNHKDYPTIKALTSQTTLDESTFQLEIIPKINSIGRYETGTTINRLLHYFSEPTPFSADQEKRAAWINEVNEKRKELTKQAADSLEIHPEDAAIVVKSSLPEGLNGLLAGRLLSQYDKPIAVFSLDEKNKGYLVGSLRSKEGFDILKAFQEAKTSFLHQGGHAFAAGCTIKESDFDSFKKDFIFSALKHKLAPKKKEAIPIALNECNMTSYRILRTFAPFGMEWEAPKFRLDGLNPTTFTYLKEGKYLCVRLTNDTKILSFSLGQDAFEPDEKVSLLLTMKRNEFKGEESLDLMAERAI